MTLRKKHRHKRPEIGTAAEYERLWWDTRYFGGNKLLSREEFHQTAFADEEALRTFYEENRQEFSEMHAPGERHALWWLHDSPQPRNEDEPEFLQLEAMGQLSAEEVEALRAKAVEEDFDLHQAPWHHGLPFRRSPLFWRFISPSPRALDMFESSQLAKLNQLTRVEKEFLADPEKVVRGQCGPRSRFYYLPKAERILVGLDGEHDPKLDAYLWPPNGSD